MIIIRIIGGLGNQMFQYAAARAFSLRRDVEVKIDTSWYDEKRFAGDAPRDFGLGAFGITLPRATLEETAALKGLGYPWRVFGGKVRRRLIGENYGYDPSFFDTPDSTYLEGFWQSESYFKGQADVIRSEFSLKARPSILAEAIEDEIRAAGDSVSVHVRRGDYVSNAKVSRSFGVLGPDYYAAAIAEVRRSVPDPQFFVFSDDIKWVRDNLPIGETARFVSDPHLTPQEEMALMSRCRHHVIANSSFSWWGAWLNPRPDKLVVAPRRWFASWKLRHRKTVPREWKKV